jgi:uncharacterized membrane protein YGL010W
MLHPPLQRLFEDYADSHRHPMNRLTHKIAIPLIVFHIIAMSDWFRVIELSNGHAITGAHFGIALSGIWYLRMDRKLGALMIAAMVACLPLGWIAPWWSVVAIAVAGWTVQLLGHAVFEKSSPAFVRNAVQALVGPIFFLAIITGDWR